MGDAIPLDKRRNAMNVGRQARHVRTHKHLKNLQRVWLTSDEQMSAFLEVLPRWNVELQAAKGKRSRLVVDGPTHVNK